MNVESPISDVKLARLMFCAAGLLGIAFGIQMLAAWKTYHHVDPTAGVWTAAALDARDGILYRPIESPLGYGGSRLRPAAHRPPCRPDPPGNRPSGRRISA